MAPVYNEVSTKADIERLAEACWHEIRQFFEPDCCVLASRIFLDSLARLGEYNATAVPIRVGLYNPAFQAEMRANGVLGPEHPEVAVPAGQQPKAITLGVAKPSNGDTPRPDATYTDATLYWPGHLGVLVRRKFIVDLSVSQASHPEHGITVNGVFVAPVTESWVTGRSQIGGVTERGVFAVYQTNPDMEQEGWQSAPDWRPNHWMHDPLVDATVSAFRHVPYRYSDEVMQVMQMANSIGGI